MATGGKNKRHFQQLSAVRLLFMSWIIINVVEQQLFSWDNDGGEDFPVSKLLVLILSFIGKLSKKPWKIKVNKKSLEFKTSSRENISMRIT